MSKLRIWGKKIQYPDNNQNSINNNHFEKRVRYGASNTRDIETDVNQNHFEERIYFLTIGY